jgi:GntR family transcriptional regulator
MPVSAPTEPPRLGPEEGKPSPDYVFLRSVQYRGDRAYSVVSVQLAKDIYERDPHAFRRHAALPIVAEMAGIKIASARQTLVIGSADPEIAGLLGVPLNAPTAEARCVVIDRRGIAIYVADIIYRGDCIRLETTLLNDGGSKRSAKG